MGDLDLLDAEPTAYLGDYDIAAKQRQMNTLRRVPVCVARALLRGGQAVAQATIDQAKGGWLQRQLPGISALQKTQAHLEWHVGELGKASDPTAMYASGDDLKKWVMQAFIDANAVEEGRGSQEQIWGQMWTDIGESLTSLPAEAAQAAGQLAGTLAQGMVSGAAQGLGVPKWLLVGGGVVTAGALGYALLQLLHAAVPVAVGVAGRRYLG